MRKWLLVLIAAYQIVGGAMGLWAFLPAASLGFWVFSAPFVLSLVAGVALLRGSPRATGLTLTTQALQVPWVSTAHLTYILAAGLGFWVHVGTDGVGVAHAAGGTLQWQIASGFGPEFDAHPVAFGLNLVPLAVIAAWALMSSRSASPEPSVGRALPAID